MDAGGHAAAQRRAAEIVPETLLQEDFQVSAHACPRAMVRELGHVFQGVPSLASAVAIPTVQHAVEDLVRTGEEVEDEKDRCLRNVRRSARIPAGERAGWRAGGRVPRVARLGEDGCS